MSRLPGLRRALSLVLLPALLGACTGKDEDTGGDTSPEVVDTGDYQGVECDVTEIRVDGNDPPVVGDTWSIFLWCDDALLTGAMVVQFTPPEVAELEENVATFVEPGSATLNVQVGRHRASRDVKIGEEVE